MSPKYKGDRLVPRKKNQTNFKVVAAMCIHKISALKKTQLQAGDNDYNLQGLSGKKKKTVTIYSKPSHQKDKAILKSNY